MEKKKDIKLEILNINHSKYTTRLSPKYKNREPYKSPDRSKLLSFIPGTVVEIMVKEGDKVKKGDEVLVLEAMKMKNRIKSPVSGLVKYIDINVNDKVPKGKLLIEFNPQQ
ncbi:MAG: acetyl-CoA carboxylase biotin carboxyl carrier protein subunit [Bacteroidales bacterium]|nr:acetyl-CoA carboxylase biotin carboxyl carrier protein subunit [Bacteroidales bacterium]